MLLISDSLRIEEGYQRELSGKCLYATIINEQIMGIKMSDSDLLIEIMRRFVLNQTDAFLIGMLILVLVAWGCNQMFSRRNFSLVLLLLPSIPLLDSLTWGIRFEQSQFTDMQAKMILEFTFGTLFAVTGLITVWTFAMSRGRNVIDWQPNLSADILKLLFIVVLIINVSVILSKKPEDAGHYTNLGAQRWLETGTMPYADPTLKGPDSPAHGAAATYGPLLYLSHIPFQLMMGANDNPSDLHPMSKKYVSPPYQASQLACLAFYLIGLWALYGIGNRLGGRMLALSLVVLYASSPYVLGLGGDKFMSGGILYISHIAPPATLLLAVYFLHRPFLSGACVAAAAGVLFFPVFFYPLFFGWHFWRDRNAALQSLAGFILIGGLIGLMVIVFTGSLDGKGPVQLLLESTLEHQEGFNSDQYGFTYFSFWGNFRELAAFWQTPLIGSSSIFKLTFLLFSSYCVSAFFLARSRTETEFALLLASLAAAVQLWKSHAGGTYVTWYYPFLLIGLFGRSFLLEKSAKPT